MHDGGMPRREFRLLLRVRTLVGFLITVECGM
jgi:hypothetical protein